MSRLDDPVFVIYVDVRGQSLKKSNELVNDIVSIVSPILGDNNIYIPVDSSSRVELLWPGNKNIESGFNIENLTELINIIDSSFELIIKRYDKDEIVFRLIEIQTFIRNLKINSLIKGS